MRSHDMLYTAPQRSTPPYTALHHSTPLYTALHRTSALILHSFFTHSALILHSCTHSALILHSFCTHSALILHSFCTHSALLHSFCTHSALIRHSFCDILHFCTHSALILRPLCTHSATNKPNTARDAVVRRGGPRRPTSSNDSRRVFLPSPRCSFPQVPSFAFARPRRSGAARRLTYYQNMGAGWVGTPSGAFPKVFINTRPRGTKTLPHLRSYASGTPFGCFWQATELEIIWFCPVSALLSVVRGIPKNSTSHDSFESACDFQACKNRTRPAN